MMNLVGSRYTKLLVIDRGVGSHPKKTYYLCECDCGVVKNISHSDLRSGRTKSCGCLNKELTTKHGLSEHKLYYTWSGMIARCYNQSGKGYYNYGGRGIKVCDRWLDEVTGLAKFIEDMGDKPSGHSIDRIDNNGDYTPDNCRWATWDTQANNRRNSRILTYNGETKPLSVWAENSKIKYRTLQARYDYGWTPDEILNTPLNGYELIEYKGESLTIHDWSKRFGIAVPTLRYRIKNGWCGDKLFKQVNKRSK